MLETNKFLLIKYNECDISKFKLNDSAKDIMLLNITKYFVLIKTLSFKFELLKFYIFSS